MKALIAGVTWKWMLKIHPDQIFQRDPKANPAE
jgi:hypothetical protein